MADVENVALEDELERLKKKRDSLKRGYEIRQEISKTKTEIKNYHGSNNLFGKLQGGISKVQGVASKVAPRLQNMEKTAMSSYDPFSVGLLSSTSIKKKKNNTNDWNGWKRK